MTHRRYLRECFTLKTSNWDKREKISGEKQGNQIVPSVVTIVEQELKYNIYFIREIYRKVNKINSRDKKSELKRYVHLTKMPMDHHIGLATFLHNDRPLFKIFCNVSPQPGTNVYIKWRFSPHRVPFLFSSGIGKLCQNEI